jgi:Domain of unknown function (DUF5666)
MKARLLFLSLAAAAIMGLLYVPSARAQTPHGDATQAPAAPPSTMQAGPEGSRRGGELRGRGVFGKISAIQADSIELIGQDGSKFSVKVTSSTEFRKERQPAKLSDFRVGDAVAVRTNQDAGNAAGATAVMIVAVPAGGFAGRGGGGGGGGGQFMMQGTMGKDYVVGEVKTVDAPKLTIVRVDNVPQTLELNEDSSLRRGRESITMADIQPGDHVFARGAVANDVFVPKNLTLIPPEQWQRMQEMMNEGGGKRGTTPQNPPAPAAPPAPSAAPTPPEQHN